MSVAYAHNGCRYKYIHLFQLLYANLCYLVKTTETYISRVKYNCLCILLLTVLDHCHHDKFDLILKLQL